MFWSVDISRDFRQLLGWNFSDQPHRPDRHATRVIPARGQNRCCKGAEAHGQMILGGRGRGAGKLAQSTEREAVKTPALLYLRGRVKKEVLPAGPSSKTFALQLAWMLRNEEALPNSRRPSAAPVLKELQW